MSERKYIQRGYQSDDRQQSNKPQGPPPPRKEGPRGRGLGAPKNEVFRCRDCGTERPIAAPIEPDTACPNCGRPLHSCVPQKPKPDIGREELEDLANRWQLARQIVDKVPLSCDAQAMEHDTCNGWDSFDDGTLARYYRELLGGDIAVKG